MTLLKQSALFLGTVFWFSWLFLIKNKLSSSERLLSKPQNQTYFRSTSAGEPPSSHREIFGAQLSDVIPVPFHQKGTAVIGSNLSQSLAHPYAATCTKARCSLTFTTADLHVTSTDKHVQRILLQPLALTCAQHALLPADPFLRSTVLLTRINETYAGVTLHRDPGLDGNLGLLRICGCSTRCANAQQFQIDLGVLNWKNVDKQYPSTSDPPVVSICSARPVDSCRVYFEDGFTNAKKTFAHIIPVGASCATLSKTFSLSTGGVCTPQRTANTRRKGVLTFWMCETQPPMVAGVYGVCFYSYNSRLHGNFDKKNVSRYVGHLIVTPSGRIWSWATYPFAKDTSFATAPPQFATFAVLKDIIDPLNQTESHHHGSRELRNLATKSENLAWRPRNRYSAYDAEQIIPTGQEFFPVHDRRLQMSDSFLPPVSTESRYNLNLQRPLQDFSSQYQPRDPILCEEDTDCLSGFGRCENSSCRGFFPDSTGERIIKCVSGYICNIKPGDLPGVRIDSDFQVIAVGLQDICGAAEPLKSTDSIFGNTNRWQCGSDNPMDCTFTAGVGIRRNNSVAVEGVRLCGCPNVDGNENGEPCDVKREFYVPLGRLTIQECMRNAHCADRGLASCDEDHCIRGAAVAATAGLKVLQCLTSRNCGLKDLGTRTVSETMKLLPIASSFSCGAEAALDPDGFMDASLPCMIDVNNDGQCEINLGTKLLGTKRLCGCVGDKGGNGRECDQIEDFTDEMGVVDIGECSSDEDCKERFSICLNRFCKVDRQPPVVIGSTPANTSYAVPPVNEITLLWQESIKFTNTERKVVIVSADPNVKYKWEVTIRAPETYNIAETGYKVTIEGSALKITPDISMASFPEGSYVVAYEGGIISDLAGNYNMGGINIMFTVSQNAGCPHLGVTGFSAAENNPNGVYTAVDPLNGHAAWTRTENQILHLYWRERDLTQGRPGSWVISSQRGGSGFLAYANLSMMENLGQEGQLRPPGQAWKKFESHRWLEHSDIMITCSSVVDRKSPILVKTDPSDGATSVNPHNFRIKLYFSEPVTYGHWAKINITARERSHEIQLAPDFQADMRGRNIKSDKNGTIELDLTGLNDLLPGTIYDVSADVGFVTDLWYNPWAEEEHLLSFTTFGVPCAPFPDLGSAYSVSGEGGHAHGASYKVQCSQNFTAAVKSVSRTVSDAEQENAEEFEPDIEGTLGAAAIALPEVVKCSDGKWDTLTFQCKSDCKHYHTLSPVYKVTNNLEIVKPTYSHGSSFLVECAEGAAVLENYGNATLECNDGRWEVKYLRCSASCGSFPSLGPNYNVALDESLDAILAGSTLVGARRVVRCAPPAIATVGLEPEVAVCEEQGWSSLQLQCHVGCVKSASAFGEGYVIENDMSPTSSLSRQQWDTDVLPHGEVHRLSCASGYQAILIASSDGSTELESHSHQQQPVTKLRCIEGRWIPSDNLKCYKNCGALNLGDGYHVVPQSGVYGEHMSTVKIQCAESVATGVLSAASVKVGPEGRDGTRDVAAEPSDRQDVEILKCVNGLWTPHELVCHAPCKRPENTLGKKSYIARIIGQKEAMRQTFDNPYHNQAEFLRHGTVAALYCAPTSEIAAGIPPETILCHDGEWVSAPENLFDSINGIMEQTTLSFRRLTKPKLVCQTRCGAQLKDRTRYVDVEGLGVLEQLARRPQPEGARRRIQCRQGFSPLYPKEAREGTLVCTDGRWVEESPFVCLRSCPESAFAEIFQRGFDLVDRRITTLDHSQTVSLKCRDKLSVRLGPPSSGVTARCYNGRITLPIHVCSEPSCSDGVRNGDETGIDCGGSSCPHQLRDCTPCRRSISTSDTILQNLPTTQQCVPSCSDGLRNGDEEGVDCGGLFCPPCRKCTTLPSEIQYGMAWSIDRGVTFHNVTSQGSTRTNTEGYGYQHPVAFPEGTLLDVMCAPGFDQISTPPLLGFQTFQCNPQAEVESGGWALKDSAYNFVLKCALPRCDDGKKNGDEWEVDCGGSCPNACPTCQDGIQNNDEEDVDCGGSRCLPCGGCSVTPFKTLSSENVVMVAYDLHGTAIQLKEFWDTRATEHNSRRKIACRQSADAFVVLECRNGVWRVYRGKNRQDTILFSGPTGAADLIMEKEKDGFRAVEALPCDAYGSEDDFYFEHGTDFPLFATQPVFRVPVLPKPRDCTNDFLYTNYASDGPPASRLDDNSETTSQPNETCCQIIPEFNEVMSSECGALLFGSRSSQISGFCTGFCMSKLQHLLEKYKYNGGLGCHTLPLLKEMISLFCSTGAPLESLPTGMAGAAEVSSSGAASRGESGVGAGTTAYCFTTITVALSQIKNFKDLRGPLLDTACLPNSCFRSLFRYFELLNALSPHSKRSGVREKLVQRNLREIARNTTQLDLADAVADAMSAFHERVFSESFESLSSSHTSSFSATDTTHSSNYMLRHLRQLGPSPHSSFMNIRQLLLTQMYSGKLLDFLCLKDSKGNSCGPSIQAIISNNESDSPAKAVASGLGSSDSCTTNKCVWEVTRYLGQSLHSQGIKSLDPYLTYIGILMRAYGRVACQTSLESKKTCASVVGFNLTALASRNSQETDPIATPYFNADRSADNLLRYPNCKCPAAYIGDQRCDTECFNPLCGFDGGDCTLQKVFPYVYQSLNTFLPVTDYCHPFSSEFDCYANSGKCRSRLTATRWDLLREILNAETELKKLSTKAYLNSSLWGSTNSRDGRYVAPLNGNAATVLGSLTSDDDLHRQLVLDRSISWVEAKCGVSFNRACSGGIMRSRLRLRFTLMHLKYDPLFTKPEYQKVAKQLVAALRATISNALALPLYDVTEIRVWPWDVDVEVIVDPGVTYPEVSKHLESLRSSGELHKLIDNAVAETFSSVTEPEKAALILTGSTLEQQVSPGWPHGARRLLQDFPGIELARINFTSNLEIASESVKDTPISTTRSPDLPLTGTLDMNDLSESLVQPPCSSSLDLSLPAGFDNEQQPGYTTPYEVDISGEGDASGDNKHGTTPHGSVRHVRCAEGYETSLRNSGPSPQLLTCDRGRWGTADPGQPKIVCRKPCSAYETWDSGFDSQALSITAIGGNKDGAARVLQCAARYAPLEGGKSPETLLCRNGVWDRRSLECGRVDELGSAALLKSGVCGNLRLNQIITQPDVYVVRQVVGPETVNAEQLRRKYSSSETHGYFAPKAPTKIQLWSLACTRGYVPQPLDERPLALLCVNDTLLAARNFGSSISWDTEEDKHNDDREALSHASVANRAASDAFGLLRASGSRYARRIIELYDTHIGEKRVSELDKRSKEDIEMSTQKLSLNAPLHLLSCRADVKVPTWVASSNPGLPDVAFYSLIFFGCLLFVALGVLVFYCKGTRCMRQPFFDAPDQANEHQEKDGEYPVKSDIPSIIFTQKARISELDTRESETVENHSFRPGETPTEQFSEIRCTPRGKDRKSSIGNRDTMSPSSSFYGSDGNTCRCDRWPITQAENQEDESPILSARSTLKESDEENTNVGSPPAVAACHRLLSNTHSSAATAPHLPSLLPRLIPVEPQANVSETLANEDKTSKQFRPSLRYSMRTSSYTLDSDTINSPDTSRRCNRADAQKEIYEQWLGHYTRSPPFFSSLTGSTQTQTQAQARASSHGTRHSRDMERSERLENVGNKVFETASVRGQNLPTVPASNFQTGEAGAIHKQKREVMDDPHSTYYQKRFCSTIESSNLSVLSSERQKTTSVRQQPSTTAPDYLKPYTGLAFPLTPSMVDPLETLQRPEHIVSRQTKDYLYCNPAQGVRRLSTKRSSYETFVSLDEDVSRRSHASPSSNSNNKCQAKLVSMVLTDDELDNESFPHF